MSLSIEQAQQQINDKIHQMKEDISKNNIEYVDFDLAVKPVNEYYKCSICFGILRNPVICDQCEKMVCTICLPIDSNCPICCNSPHSRSKVYRVINQSIDNIVFTHTCGQHLYFNQRNDHICDRNQVKCLFCNQYYTSNILESHIDICIKRKLTCHKCNQTINGEAAYLQHVDSIQCLKIIIKNQERLIDEQNTEIRKLNKAITTMMGQFERETSTLMDMYAAESQQLKQQLITQQQINHKGVNSKLISKHQQQLIQEQQSSILYQKSNTGSIKSILKKNSVHWDPNVNSIPSISRLKQYTPQPHQDQITLLRIKEPIYILPVINGYCIIIYLKQQKNFQQYIELVYIHIESKTVTRKQGPQFYVSNICGLFLIEGSYYFGSCILQANNHNQLAEYIKVPITPSSKVRTSNESLLYQYGSNLNEVNLEDYPEQVKKMSNSTDPVAIMLKQQLRDQGFTENDIIKYLISSALFIKTFNVEFENFTNDQLMMVSDVNQQHYITIDRLEENPITHLPMTMYSIQ